MANNIAFQPMGNTVAITATGSANTQSNVVTVTATSPVNQYYLVNGMAQGYTPTSQIKK